MRPLSERRATDRAEMARRIESLVTECGATFERTEGGDYPGPRAIQIYVRAARGLCVRVEFDGASTQADTHVLSWHTDVDSTAELSAARFGGNVNPYHRQKATYIASGFDALCERLQFGLELAKSGAAFL
jgi:hypothetical protein